MIRVRGRRNQVLLAGLFTVSLLLCSVAGRAQTPVGDLQPNLRRTLPARQNADGKKGRPNGYVPVRGESVQAIRSGSTTRKEGESRSSARPATAVITGNAPAAGPIPPAIPLPQVLHTSQLSLTSTAGTDEQFFDANNDLIADQRTTFDAAGGSFDIAVGRSGSRYEVFSATLNGQLVGIIVVARDTNGDYFGEPFPPIELRSGFGLRSAAAVVTGNSKSGREFVIVCSSGFFNFSNPNDPNNEPSPGVILLVRDPNTGLFDDSRSRTLVTVGDNRLFNANALALLPNNDLLVADFTSNELRIIRDTDADGMPDTLSATPYYSYRFSNDAPLDIAVNQYGVVFSHSEGNDTVMLVLYDDNADGQADRDEVCVEGLSIDNNLLLHGLTVDGKGSVYVIEDANGSADGAGGNGGSPRVDAFPDQRLDGFLSNGAVFTSADDGFNQALTGLSFGALPANKLDDPQFFVRQHYLDFFSREADPSGLAFWTNQINDCNNSASCRELKRINVSAAFFLSIEFQETGYLVYKFYKAAYGNLPGEPVPLRFSEFLPDTRQIGAGIAVGIGNWQQQLEENKRAYAAGFVASSSFTNTYSNSLTPAQFVDALFANAGVTPSAAERTAAINEFGSATTSADTAARARAMRRVAENSTLSAQEFNRAFVLMQYYGYLRRNPYDPPELTLDFAGYNFWLNKLNQFNGNFINAEMVKAFITSGEYRQRFGP
jgi:hypothetical protein